MACDTGKLYPHSFDGTSVATWLADLDRGLVQEANLQRAIASRRFNSVFIQAVADAYTALGRDEDYDQFTSCFDLMRDFTIGARCSLLMRPTPLDYDLVAYHLPMYALKKSVMWLGTLSWYDIHNIYFVAAMMRRWGSLALVSQEGMEGWQKMLNQVLRQGNGFANSGAIKLAAKDATQEERAAYMAKRAEGKSPAKWVYDQALLKDYSRTLRYSLGAYEALKPRPVPWTYHTSLWDRYQAALRLYFPVLAWYRRQKAILLGSTYYRELLNMHNQYWLEWRVNQYRLYPKFKRLKLRTTRHLQYRKYGDGMEEHPDLNPPLPQQEANLPCDTDDDEPNTPPPPRRTAPKPKRTSFHAVHPCQRTHELWYERAWDEANETLNLQSTWLRGSSKRAQLINQLRAEAAEAAAQHARRAESESGEEDEGESAESESGEEDEGESGDERAESEEEGGESDEEGGESDEEREGRGGVW